jgi:hypothetical protein
MCPKTQFVALQKMPQNPIRNPIKNAPNYIQLMAPWAIPKKPTNQTPSHWQDTRSTQYKQLNIIQAEAHYPVHRKHKFWIFHTISVTAHCNNISQSKQVAHCSTVNTNSGIFIIPVRAQCNYIIAMFPIQSAHYMHHHQLIPVFILGRVVPWEK